MTGQHRIVVLGAGYAGLAAARRFARKSRDTRVTLVDARAEFVERVRLHQRVAGQRTRAWDLRELLAGTRIDFVQARAVGLDPDAGQLRLDSGAVLDFETLVYALGSTAAATVPGVAEYAFVLATPEDAARIAVSGAGPVAVVGAGSTGIELAAELAETQPHSRVLLLGSEEPGAWLSARAGAHIRQVLQRLGVEIHSAAKVVEVTEAGPRLADGTVLAAATTIWTAGFAVPQLAAEAGIAVDASGRILTDASLRSVSHPNIYAAGDSAVIAGPGDRELRMACATALPAGKYAADAVAARLRGREPRKLAFRYVVQCLSLGRRDGVIQFLHADDRPARTVLTGRSAAWVKERIVRGAAAATRP